MKIKESILCNLNAKINCKIIIQLILLFFLVASVSYAQTQYAVNNDGADDEGICQNAWPAEILGNYVQNGTNNGRACYQGPNNYWLYHANMSVVGEAWVVGYPLGSTDINGDNIRFYYTGTANTPPINVNYTHTHNGCGAMYVSSGGAAPPPAPTLNNPSNVGATSMDLSWSQSSGATGYHVYVSTNSTFTALVSGLDPKDVPKAADQPYPPQSTSISGLNRGTTYYVRVRAYSGAGESSNSNTVNATTAPSAPVATNASNPADQSFTANWNAASGANWYSIYVSTNSSFSSYVTGYNGQNVGNVTNYTVSGLTANTTYYYRLKASNSAGTSDYSNTITTTTIMAPPVSAAASSITQTSFSANWNAANQATGYYLDVATNSNFSSMVSGFNNKDVGNVTTYSVTGLTGGTTYYYRVRAFNINGTSGNSSTQNLITLSPPPVATAGTNIRQTSFTANWNGSSGATGYVLDVASDNGFTNFVTGYNNLDVSNVLTYSVNTNLAANTTYYYRIRAYNDSGTGSYSNTINLTTAPETPLTQAGPVIVSNIKTTQMQISWTNGNGASRAVFVKEGNSGTASPVNSTTYTANTHFMSGTQIGVTGWYCVFNNIGNSVSVDNLMPGSAYQIMVCEYNGSAGLESYNTDSVESNPVSGITQTIMINELDASVSNDKEFIELFDGGTGNVELGGLVVVLYNGDNDQSYKAIDLDGYSTDANGYFIIGNAGVNGVDLTFASNTLQNGADAVALYLGSGTDFPNGTAVTTTNIVDAVVYDNDNADDAGLLILLTSGSQINENGRGMGEIHSMQRIPNGGGGLRSTSSYVIDWPTPKSGNITSPEIDIKGNGNSIVDGDTTSSITDDTDFGNVDVNGSSTNTYTIENAGLATLNISGVSPYIVLSGTNADQFSVTNAPSNSVSSGSSTSFDIEFSPTTTGVKTAIVTVTSDDDDEGSYDFKISGTGVVPEINVKQSAANIEDGTGSYDFGGHNVGVNTDVTFTVENTGIGNLTLSSITLGGTNADQFSVQQEPASPVNGGNTTTFVVRFIPTTYGLKTASVSFSNNDENENPYNFTITGTGMAPEIVVQEGINDIPDGTGIYNYGSKNVGTNTDVTYTIINIGNLDLTLGNITLGGENADQFSVQEQPYWPLSAGDSTSFIVRFTPTTYAEKTASVSFVNNDGDENPFNFTINGTGLEPEIAVKENSNNIADGTVGYNFGNKDVGTNTDVTFKIENIGNINLTLGSVTLSGANTDQFSVQQQASSPVGGSDSTSFEIRFAPTTYGAKTATVSFNNNDANENPFNFSINGTGVECEINVKQGVNNIADGTGSFNFGDRYVATDTVVIFTIENIGNSNLTLGNAVLSGPNADQFSVSVQPASTVSASNSTSFQIKFSPTTYGSKTATVLFSNNDANENPFDFLLNGTGLEPEINIKEDTNNIADGIGTYNFGAKLIGESKETVFTVENIGNNNLVLGFVTINGVDADQFSVQQQPASPVSGSGSTTFVIRFTPTAVGAKTATVQLNNNDGNENPYDFTITASAASPEINLREGVNNIADGGSYDFGTKDRATNTDVIFTIENSGSSDLNLGGTPVITLGGADADQFSVQSLPVTPIAPSENSTFTIRFNPTSLGAKTATISITNDDINENPYDITLNGNSINVVPSLANIEAMSLEYTENSGAMAVTSTITLTDADDNYMMDAVVQITGNYQQDEDILEFKNTESITGTWESSAGKMTLTGSDSKANYEIALRSVAYRNISDNPVTTVNEVNTQKTTREITSTPRTISVTVNDGNDISNIVTRDITLTAQNDAPTIILNTGLSVNEGENKVIDDSMLKSYDLDNDQLSTRYYVTEEPQHGSIIIANSANLKIDQSIINNTVFTQNQINQGKLTYKHDGTEAATDSFKFYLMDNEGGTSQEYEFSITVNTINDLPVLSNIEETNLVYIVNSPPVNLTSAIKVNDADNSVLTEAVIQIESYKKGLDFLTLENSDIIANVFDVETGTLTLTGQADLAAYQSALRSVEFSSISNIESIGIPQTITFTVNDGTNVSNSLTRSIDVVVPTESDPDLPPPSEIAVSFMQDKKIQISWHDNSDGELGFIIYRVIVTSSNKVSSIFNFEMIGIVGENIEEFWDENVGEGVSYQYKVEVYNEAGFASSNDDEGQLSETLFPPSNLTLDNAGSNNVILNWVDNSEIETKYAVERNDGNGYLQIAELDANTVAYSDNGLSDGWHYYRVKAINNNSESTYSNIAELFVGATLVNKFGDEIPTDFVLTQNYPNPFNPVTTIRYGIPETANVRITVYNILGQEVITLINMIQTAGYYEAAFKGSSLNSGVYLYKIQAGNFIEIKKMILLK